MPKLSQLKKDKILVRDNYTCAYCGKRAATVDHVKPISLGGGNEPENLVAACSRCNAWKSSRSAEEFKKYIEKRIKREG